MSKDSKPPENQDLVNALESIRSLLEKSETKLSAARESLQKAKPAPKTYKKTPISTEPVVPVLDDVVMSAATEEEEDSIPMLDDIQEEITGLFSMPAEDSPPPAATRGNDLEEMMGYLDTFQADMEKQLHQSLIQAMVKAETEIKQALQAQFQQLRDKLKNR